MPSVSKPQATSKVVNPTAASGTSTPASSNVASATSNITNSVNKLSVSQPSQLSPSGSTTTTTTTTSTTNAPSNVVSLSSSQFVAPSYANKPKTGTPSNKRLISDSDDDDSNGCFLSVGGALLNGLPPVPSPSLDNTNTNRTRAPFNANKYRRVTQAHMDNSGAIMPNGSATESSLDSLMMAVRYCLVLVRIATFVTEDYLREYGLTNALPRFADVVVFQLAARALLFFDELADFQFAAAHAWGIGEVDQGALARPLDNHSYFYRAIYGCITNYMDNMLEEVAEAFSYLDIEVVSVAASRKNAGQINVYFAGFLDYVKALQCRVTVLVTGVNGRPNTLLNPRHHLAQSSNSAIIRLHIGNLPMGVCELKIIQRIKQVLGGTNFQERHILSFYVHRAFDTNKQASFGFLQVFGKELANYLCSSEVTAKLNVIRISPVAKNV